MDVESPITTLAERHDAASADKATRLAAELEMLLSYGAIEDALRKLPGARQALDRLINDLKKVAYKHLGIAQAFRACVIELAEPVPPILRDYLLYDRVRADKLGKLVRRLRLED